MSEDPIESTIVKQILAALRAEGGWWVKLHGGPYQSSGLPDIVGCIGGRFVGFEVKRPSRRDKVSKMQAAVLESIQKAGGVSAVVASPEEALGKVKEVHEK